MKIEKEIIIAIDPAWAKPYGVVVFKDDGVLEAGLKEYSDLFYILEFYGSNFYTTVVIEEPYLGMNANTLLKLGFAVGGVIMVCSLFNMEYVFVKPMHWKKYFSLTSNIPAKERAEIKNQICPKNFLQKPDLQDAYLIGRYYIEKVRK